MAWTCSNALFRCLCTSRLFFRASNYCRTLEGLIRIAPPPQKNYPFATNLSQTILVTHYFQPSLKDSQKGGDDSEDDNDVHIYGYRGEDRTGQSAGEGNEEEDGIGTASAAEVSQEVRSDASTSLNCTPSTDDDNTVKNDDGVNTWPPEYSKFVESSVVQENLALEIASGGGVSQRPKEIQKGNVRIVIPGSLRERGEFCLVDMSLMEQAVKKNFTAASTSAASSAKKKSTFAWRVRSVEFHSIERLP